MGLRKRNAITLNVLPDRRRPTERLHSPTALAALHVMAFLLHTVGPVALVWTLYRLGDYLAATWTTWVAHGSARATLAMLAARIVRSRFDVTALLGEGPSQLHAWVRATIEPVLAVGLPMILEVWAAAEAVFVLYCWWLWRWMQRKPFSAECGFTGTIEEQLELARYLGSAIRDGHEFFGGWFLDETPQRAERRWDGLGALERAVRWIRGGHARSVGRLACAERVRRDNVKEWLAWAFLGQEADASPETAATTERLLGALELELGITFRPGRDPYLRSIRLHFDPVLYLHKPLLFYLAIACMDFFRNAFLRSIRFRPPPPATKDDPRVALAHDNIRFWYYKPVATDPVQTQRRQIPIVLVHGLGPGLSSYTKFLLKIRQFNPYRPILVVEQPFLGMHVNADVPTVRETVRSIEATLGALGHARAVFVGHSLGTAVVTWMMRHTDCVAGCVMFDPVVFNVFQPTLAYNFFHRRPQTVPECLLRYMVARELFTAFYIGRHFYWHQNLCLPHYFPEKASSTCHVFLSTHDHLIDVPSTLTHLRRHGIPVTVFEGLEHAEVLLYRHMENMIVHRVHSCADAAEDDQAQAAAAARAQSQHLPTSQALDRAVSNESQRQLVPAQSVRWGATRRALLSLWRKAPPTRPLPQVRTVPRIFPRRIFSYPSGKPLSRTDSAFSSRSDISVASRPS